MKFVQCVLVVVALVGTACAQGIDGRVNLDVGDQIRVSITSHCGLETLEILSLIHI